MPSSYDVGQTVFIIKDIHLPGGVVLKRDKPCEVIGCNEAGTGLRVIYPGHDKNNTLLLNQVRTRPGAALHGPATLPVLAYTSRRLTRDPTTPFLARAPLCAAAPRAPGLARGASQLCG